MQDPFIFNLNSTDDNGGMKEDPVELKASRKIKMNVCLMHFLVHATQRFPAVSKGSFESACAICNILLILKRFFNSLTPQT